VIVALGLLAARPWLLWAYNVERAGREMDAGLVWPEPRYADSLPKSRDERRLENALSYLATAMRWRPQDAYAQRRVGEIYAARQDWWKAAQTFETARTLAPRDPLLAWESSLIYDAMWRVVQAASRENIVPDLVSVPIEAPATPINTGFCRNDDPQSCYVGLDKWTQPYADLPKAPPITADVVFMYPPSSVKLTRPIYGDHPVMSFLLGLNPGMRGMATDGATFQVFVQPEMGAPARVYERTIDGATAKQGWIPDMVDLSPWAGQTVTLTLQTLGGPANNTAGDWYGWGNVIMTTREATEYVLLAPETKMRLAWQAAGIDAKQLLNRGEQARYHGRPAEALAWYQRAETVEPTWNEPWYYAGLVYKSMQDWEKALQSFEQASKRAPDNRDIWYELGQVYTARQEWGSALQAYKRGARATTGQMKASDFFFAMGVTRQIYLNDLDGAWDAYQQALKLDDFSATAGNKLETFVWRGTILQAQQRWDQAVQDYERAVALFPQDFRLRLGLAQSLWPLGRHEPAKASALRATELQPKDKTAFRWLADVYAAEGNVANARKMYTQVLALDPQDTSARQALEKLSKK
jgi:tetratricopeptide (TPR) repeat protein